MNLKLKTYILSVFILLSCSKNTDTEINAPKSTIDFSYTIVGVIEDSSYISAKENTSKRSVDNIEATMTIVNQSTLVSEDIDIIVSFDTSNMTISSSFYTMLAYGTYKISLNMTYMDYTYTSEESLVVIDENYSGPTNLIIKPVIGDLNVDFTTDKRTTMKFDYSSYDMSSISYPRIGYSINGGSEVIVALNTQIEAELDINEVYLDLADGTHNIKLRFFDGAFLIGKSVEAQEDVAVLSTGLSIAYIDIEPIYTTFSANSSGDGSNLSIELSIPQSIIDIVEGINNLDYNIQLYGGNNDLITPSSTNISQGIYNYLNVSFNVFNHEETSFLFTFTDSIDDSVVASVVFENIIIKNEIVVLQEALSIADNTINHQDYRGSVTINIVDTLGTPVNGVKIHNQKKEDTYLGITNNLSTNQGSSYFWHNKGVFTIVLEKEEKIVQQIVNLTEGEDKIIDILWLSSDKEYINDYIFLRDLRNMNQAIIDPIINNDNVWAKDLKDITTSDIEAILNNLNTENNSNSPGDIIELNSVFDTNINRITRFCIESIGLTDIPESIGNMTELTYLTIRNTNITTIPNEIEGLTKLEILLLDRNDLNYIPPGIGNLSSLLELYIYQNELTSVPEEFWNMTNLERIDIDDNNLLFLSTNVKNLVNLKVLYMDGNAFTDIPIEVSYLTNLEQLYVRRTNITCLPQEVWDMNSDFGTNIFEDLPGKPTCTP